MKALDRQLQRLRIRQVMPLIQSGQRVLDIGCADGTLYRHASGLGAYVGIDPDAPHAPPGSNAQFIRTTFPTPQLDPDARFDVIVALAVLEHVPVPEQSAFAVGCRRHLAQDGHLAITVPARAVDRILGILKRTRLLDGMHEEQHWGYDPLQTPDIFEPHGFRLSSHRRFELGLNYFFVLQRCP